MNEIGIETAQNVVVHHEVASVGDRILAYILDALIIGAWVFVWFLLSALLSQGGTVMIVMMVVFVAVPYMFYHLVCELTMDGQSIGKRVRKIKVARVDGGQPRIGQYLLRWILRPIDGFYGLGLVVMLINGKGQRLGDLAAGTTVITLKQRLQLKDTLMTQVGDGHRVRFPEAVRLNDAQARMIREVLNNTKVVDRVALIEEMAAKVRVAIGNNGDGLQAWQFLQSVLQDYVHLTAQQGQQPTNR
ncbi:MAG TPA: RDD family protein [Flavobacteriales bacterium]|nr:RDD family protein [Flavobacteriales bacterium]